MSEKKNFENQWSKPLQVSFFVIFTGLFSFSLGVFVGKNWSDRQVKRGFHFNRENSQGNSQGNSFQPLSRPEIQNFIQKDIQEDDFLLRFPGKRNKKKRSEKLNSLEPQGLFGSSDFFETPVSKSGPGQSIRSVPGSKQSGHHGKRDPNPGVLRKRKPEKKFFYTIQVSAYKTEKEAEIHVRNLIEKGFPAFFLEKKTENGTWFRVSIGTFKKKKLARKYEKALKQQTWIKESLIRKVPGPKEKSY